MHVEVPGVVAPCGHVHERPEPIPMQFRINCHCGKNWVLVWEYGSWKATEV